MTPHTFIAKWGPGGPGYELNERQGAQQHFIELCALLGVPAPTGVNDGRDDYLFEKGTLALGQQRGFADVFKRGCFAWEYKAPGRPLGAALAQLMRYALALENPPLLVVSDRLQIEIHTHFNGTPSERHVVALHELTDPAKRELLRRAFDAPESFKPKRTNRQITEEAAQAFATTAERLRGQGLAAESVSHFLTQCLFCFFAEDVGLLPQRLFEKLVGHRIDADRLRTALRQLFTTMQTGGLFGVDDIPWFNGGLFARIDVPPLSDMDVAALRNAAALDWSAIDPSIFGTLFERGLDPKKRSQLGAHYTDPATIERLIDPVIRRPLQAEWAVAQERMSAALAKSKRGGDKPWRDAQSAFVGYLERLREYRVLDPACGSGNFLYLALKCLKDLEHRANLEAEALGLQREVDSYTSPANVLGIELNGYAAELARVTVWIGELQWRLQHGYPFKVNPVLELLDQIDCRDALMNVDGSEAMWPKVDAVVGNPPFVGDKKMRAELGDAYTETLRATFKGRVPGGADLVCYWFEKARAQIKECKLQRAGLVSSNTLPTGTANKQVLLNVARVAVLTDAWRDLPWINNGAALRVALTCFAGGEPLHFWLNGEAVAGISADLQASTANDRVESPPPTLAENARTANQGITKGGKFDVAGDVARDWLALPNPNGRPNSDVLKPWWNGEAVTDRNPDKWIVDLTAQSEAQAACYEAPFELVVRKVKPRRLAQRRESRKQRWWQFNEVAPTMRAATALMPRWIVSPETPTHTVFAWMPQGVIPDKNLVVIARADDATFGVLLARFHLLWVRRWGSPYGNHPTARRYTSTRTFDPFPFPNGLTPADTAHQRTEPLPEGALIPADLPASVRPHAEAIARAAHALNALRERWRNPPEWTERVPEVVPLGMTTSPYPDRIVAKPGFETQLAQRTLTKLYNERPAWLAQAHQKLDAAVAAAYGWADYTSAMPDDEILRRLLALNRARAGAA